MGYTARETVRAAPKGFEGLPLREDKKPIIAVVDDLAVGDGMEMVLAVTW